MSYASDMKKELTFIEITNNNKFLSELSSLIKMNGIFSEVDEKLIVTIQTENKFIAMRIFNLVKYFYDVNINISVRKQIKLKKNNIYICRITDKAKEILKKLYILTEDNNFNKKIDSELIDDDDKKRSYLRGAFLAGGSINDPKTSGYHLEIFSQYQEHSVALLNLFNYYNLNARILKKKKGFIVYIKESEKISDFINIIGAINSYFKFEDERIIRDISNSVNRMQNCDLANINKIVNASTKQVKDINIIEERLGLDNLDEKLKVVAKARLKYPESPLKEIAEIIGDGKLSKSGLNHRFKKISIIAKKLKEGTYQ